MPRPLNAASLRAWRSLVFAGVLAFCAPLAARTVVVPNDFASIEEALAAVEGTTDAQVIVEPGTYQQSFALPDNVVLTGRETARTFLVGSETAPVITANGTLGARVSNFTFVGIAGNTAVAVSGGSNLVISNNVFAVGAEKTAISVQAATPTIEHNVFFQNGAAIDAGNSVFTIRNNAFVDNVETLTQAPVDQSAISNNGFFANDATATFGANVVTTDPRFVATDALDFHLRTGSPYINAGTGTNDALDNTVADIGAYGGARADNVPFPVGTPTIAASTADSITLRWPANNWYLLGGYRVHYDSDEAGAPYDGDDADGGASPIDVGNVTEYTLTGLDPATAPAAPVLAQPEPLNGALRLSWSAVPSAAGYVVNYGIASANENAIDVGNVTTYTLGGLENGTTYRITVNAYATANYFLAVTAYPNFNAALQSALSQEVSLTIGARAPGPPSNEISDFPEPIVPFPNLPETGGCFIATAAYGHYSAAEVQLLRRFRDRYLLTHAPGRTFVAWYYRHSPQWARALDANPSWKPFVRFALLPAVGLAAFLFKTPTVVQVGVALLLGVALFRLRAHRRSVRA